MSNQMQFGLEPYKAVGPLRFDMSEADVVTALGKPERRSRNWRGEVNIEYSNIVARLSNQSGRLVEVAFVPGAELVIDGIDVFNDKEALLKLAARDGDPQESVGFVVLFRFGAAMTGFHDNDESQKAVTVFAEGRWDEARSRMRPFLYSLPEGSRD